MEKEEFEKKLDECWKEFWASIYTPNLNLGYWEPMFAETYHTGFHKGFAFAFGKDYSDAVFEAKHLSLSQDSANCDNHSVQDHEMVNHIVDVSNMMRLNIAAQMVPAIMAGSGDKFYYHLPGSKSYMPSMISKLCPAEVARVAFIFADALIAEAQKGGAK